jgi:hypothetical protein
MRNARCLSVGQEPDFGALSATAPVPDPTRVTYTGLLCDMAQIVPFGEPVAVQRDMARKGPYVRPAEPVTIYADDGSAYPRAKGQVQVTIRAHLIGDAVVFADYDALPFAWMLGASMNDDGAQTAAGAVSAPDTVNSFKTANPTPWRVGELIKAIRNGRTEYSAVTDVAAGASDTISHSPAFSARLDVADTPAKCRPFFVPCGAITPGKSLSFQYDGPGQRRRAFGCRWSQLQIVIEAEEVIFKFTFQALYIRSYESEPAVTAGTNVSDPPVPDGPTTSLLGGVSVLSSASSANQAVGAKLGRLAIAVEVLEITLTATLVPAGATDSILGCSDLVVADMDVEASLTLGAIQTTLDYLLLNQEPRSLMVGCGGYPAGTGMCFYMPSAVVQNDPGIRDASGELVKQVLRLKPGHWGGDDGTTALAGSLFRIGLST